MTDIVEELNIAARHEDASEKVIHLLAEAAGTIDRYRMWLRQANTERKMEKRIVHCWEDGPETEDGCSTTCMLLDGHEGDHDWVRDDRIGISFAPAAPVETGE
jgi:hypothetical protein